MLEGKKEKSVQRSKEDGGGEGGGQWKHRGGQSKIM